MLTIIDKLLIENAKKGHEGFTSIDYIGEDMMTVEKQPSGTYEEDKLVPRRKKVKRSASLFARSSAEL
jgi:hypothetical protein